MNGLTAQVQYFATGTSGTDFAISSATDTHTFNLPTASAANRGALSSADWTTFNGKISGTGASGQVAYFTGATTQAGSNNLFWDNANIELGIGTNTPANSLHIKRDFNDGTFARFENLTAASSSATGMISLTDGGVSSGFITYSSARLNNGSTQFNSGQSAVLYYQGPASLNIASTFATGTNAGIKFWTAVSTNDGIERARITAGGNFIINNAATDSGERLQTTGTAVIKDITTSSVASALLQLSSTTKGFLPPRMTTSEKLAITSPATGLQVYDTTLNLMSFYNGTSWVTGGGGGQILNFPVLSGSGNLTAGTPYHFGATTSPADTSGNRNRGVFNKAGTIKNITIVFRATNAPASNSNPIDFKKATGNGAMSVVASTTFNYNGQSVLVFNWTGLNISVAVNDTYEFSIISGFGVTNSIITGHIEVQLS